MSQSRKTPAVLSMTTKDGTKALTVGEFGFIRKKFNKSFGDLDPFDTLAVVVWMHERRRTNMSITWEDMQDWSLQRLQDYFEDEPVEADDDDPDSELGKGE